MTTKQWNLDAILESRDRAERLAGADWLEEQGDDVNAYMVRWCTARGKRPQENGAWGGAHSEPETCLPFWIREAAYGLIPTPVLPSYWSLRTAYGRLALALQERLAVGDPDALIPLEELSR